VAEEAPKEEATLKNIVHEPRLFKSKSHGFGFKLRTLFKSKESLAAEMQKALCDTDSQLLAFVIRGSNKRLVPHSAFHSLETTHMRTILSQLKDDTWYKTFISLNTMEHSVLQGITHSYTNGKIYERQVVVLKVIQENRPSAWALLLRKAFEKYPIPNGHRSVLAIVREQLVNGEPFAPNNDVKGHYTPFSSSKTLSNPLPEKPLSAPNMPVVRPPFLPSNPGSSRMISDLENFCPSPTPGAFFSPPLPPPPPQNFNNNPRPGMGGPPPPPPPPNFNYNPRPGMPGPPPPPPPARGPPPPGLIGATATQQRNCSVRISDTTPLTDYDATIALTTYNEYTVRICEAIQPDMPRSWTRVATTLESAEKHVIQERVDKFLAAGGNVIQAKMRLTDEQSDQVTRLMDELKVQERDNRFDWFWVEISLFDKDGEMVDQRLKGADDVTAKATLMHLIAKRVPKPHCRPMELYNTLMRPPPPPQANKIPGGPPGGPPPRPWGPPRPPIIVQQKRRSRSRYSSSSSGSDTDSDWSSSSSGSTSVGHVRRRIRRLRSRKGKSRRYVGSDSESGSDSDSETNDPMKLKVEIKRGDDVVKKLLDLWTPSGEDKGKGKEVL
jgi:hypothetical protein